MRSVVVFSGLIVNVTYMTDAANECIMENMKRILLMFVAVMFLANIFVVSAWAKPCLKMDMSLPFSVPVHQVTEDKGGMPCHDGQAVMSLSEKASEKPLDQPSTTPHCDGVCLCFHVSVSTTPILSDDFKLTVPVPHAEKLFLKNASFASVFKAPPHRPPKNIT